jgi:EmrB/QacA subfamily drug resistance transporter
MPVVVTTRRKRLILATLCLALFMSMLDNVVVSNALPSISADLSTGVNGLQWVMEGYSLVFASLLLLAGALGDRYGQRRPFLIGLVLFTAGSTACALAGSLAQLVVGRVVQGVGAALLTPQSLALVRLTFESGRERARAIGVWSGVSALGLALGPAIGGPLVTAFGWTSAFWINVPVGVAALLLGVLVLPRTAGHRRPLDLRGQVLGTVAVAACVFALIEGPARGWGSPAVVTGAVAALVCLVLFVPVELGTEHPVLDLRLLRDRVLSGATLAGFVVSFGMFGVLSYLGIYLQSVLGWTAAAAGIASLPTTAAVVVLSPVASRIAYRWGARLPLLAGLTCCATGLAVLSRVQATSSYADFWWALPLLGAGMGLSFSPISTTAMARVAPDRTGMAAAMTNTARELGGVAGIAVIGSVLTARLTTSLTRRLAADGVPADVVQQVTAEVASSGAGHAGGAGLAGLDLDGLAHAVALSFTDGLRGALLAATAVLVAGAVVVAVLMRPEPVPHLSAPEGATAGRARAGG